MSGVERRSVTAGRPRPQASIPPNASSGSADAGVTTFEVTAIERDGLLIGPDLALYERMVAIGRGAIIASAGISTLDDLRAVHAIGCTGAIVGRALYEGRLDLADAIEMVRDLAARCHRTRRRRLTRAHSGACAADRPGPTAAAQERPSRGRLDLA